MYSNVHELLRALKSRRCDISADAIQIITGRDFTIAHHKSISNLVIRSARQLGLEEPVCYGEMFVEGVIRGLRPCPTELGLQLRHQYQNQPKKEFLRVISNSRLLDPYGRTSIFTLSQLEGASFLNVYTATPDTQIGLDDTYVWVDPDT